MKIVALVKYPPIEGGVAAQSYWMCRALAERGHDVTVVTNAGEVEPEYGIVFGDGDIDQLAGEFSSGGRLSVEWTAPWDNYEWHHVPDGNPTVSRLAGTAIRAIEANGADVILSNYLEPYGVAAGLTAMTVGVPWVVQHAGSDRYRMMQNPELGRLYASLLRNASAIIETGCDLTAFGRAANDVLTPPQQPFLPGSFSPSGGRLDLAAAVSVASSEGLVPDSCNTGNFDRAKIVIGSYGKLGRVKGTYDLLQAYAASDTLRERSSLVFMSGGIMLERTVEMLRKLSLLDDVWLLPFMPHWRVPEFIRACDLLCFLERDFDVVQHGPGVLREVLSCGKPIVVSGEVADKQIKREPDQVAAWHTVRDPSNIEDLRTTLIAAVDELVHAGSSVEESAVANRSPNPSQSSGKYWDSLVREIEAVGKQVAPAKCDLNPQWREAARTFLDIHAPTLSKLFGEMLLHATGQRIVDRKGGTWISALVAEVDSLDWADVRPAPKMGEVSTSPQDWRRDVEVARAEVDLLWAAADLAVPGSPAVPRSIPAALAGTRSFRLVQAELDNYPVVSGSYRIASWTENVWRALQARKDAAGRTGASAQASSLEGSDRPSLVLISKPMDLEYSVFRVSEMAVRVLELCDGTVTFPELRESLAVEGQTGSQIDRLLEKFESAGLIKVVAKTRNDHALTFLTR